MCMCVSVCACVCVCRERESCFSSFGSSRFAGEASVDDVHGWPCATFYVAHGFNRSLL